MERDASSGREEQSLLLEERDVKKKARREIRMRRWRENRAENTGEEDEDGKETRGRDRTRSRSSPRTKARIDKCSRTWSRDNDRSATAYLVSSPSLSSRASSPWPPFDSSVLKRYRISCVYLGMRTVRERNSIRRSRTEDSPRAPGSSSGRASHIMRACTARGMIEDGFTERARISGVSVTSFISGRYASGLLELPPSRKPTENRKPRSRYIALRPRTIQLLAYRKISPGASIRLGSLRDNLWRAYRYRSREINLQLSFNNNINL